MLLESVCVRMVPDSGLRLSASEEQEKNEEGKGG